MEDIVILDVFWDRQLVRDGSGNEYEIFRGKDYDLGWVRLGHGYSKDGKGVYLWNDPCFNKYRKQISLPTFEMIQANEAGNTFYFRDENAVYIDSHMAYQIRVENADPKDFRILDIDQGYATSNGKDYWYDSELPYRISEIKHINGSYQQVGNSIYFGHIEKLSCHPETFEIVHEKVPTVARDSEHVFFKSSVIEGADPETFRFMEECTEDDAPAYLEDDIHFYATDKRYAYFVDSTYGVKIIKTKDLSNFRFIVKDGIGYGIDSNYLYEKGRRRKLN